MASNEDRAKLIGLMPGIHEIPDYPADANAVAELRAFVRARGKTREFVRALDWQLTADTRGVSRFELLNATPAQQTKAFDAVFKDELEKIQ